MGTGGVPEGTGYQITRVYQIVERGKLNLNTYLKRKWQNKEE